MTDDEFRDAEADLFKAIRDGYRNPNGLVDAATSSGLTSLDDYCRVHAVAAEDRPAAFAAYLHEVSDGVWDDDYRRLIDNAGDTE